MRMEKDAIREHEWHHDCRVVSVCRKPGGMKLLYCVPRSGRREFLVDVVAGHTFIAGTLCGHGGTDYLCHLDEELLDLPSRHHVQKLKERIVEVENGGTIEDNGQYPPKNSESVRELVRWVNQVEKAYPRLAWICPEME